MSRCFPYPPPGCTLSSARNEALIESIKLQKEKERKKEKKEKKKEKKEKRKEKKEKRKDETNPNLETPNLPISDKSDTPKHHISINSDTPNHQISNKSDTPKHHITKNGPTDKKVKFFHEQQRKAETVQLEQSSLTEEHECPTSLPVPSSSSESTEKSKKRKKISSPGNDTHVQGKVILLRLPSKKQNEFDALAKEQPPCSTSERSDKPDGSRDVNCVRLGPAKFSNRKSNSTAQNTEHICSTSGQIEAGKAGTNSKPTFPKKEVLTPMQKLELQYTNLLENCFPPPIQEAACVVPKDDLDWLLAGSNQETRPEKKSRFGSEILSCSRSSGLWPRAEYLPEVEIYALPYTVPY